jgi:hypothetical protein
MGLLRKLIDKTGIYTTLAISFLTGLFFGKLIVLHYETTTFKPWEWQNPPVILNCYGPMLRPVYINKAVSYWQDKGERILLIEHETISRLCKNKYKISPGFIKIYQANNLSFTSNKILAYTIRKASSPTGIIGANILIRSGTYTIKHLLTHELGHAFGYTHVQQPGHIMHPITEQMSDKFWIP